MNIKHLTLRDREDSMSMISK